MNSNNEKDNYSNFYMQNKKSSLSRVEENISKPIIDENDEDLLVSEPLGKYLIREALEWTLIFVAAFFISMFINAYIVETTEVIGDSMKPTLHEGERLFVDKFVYKVFKPQRGDIIVFMPDSDSKNYVKRVIALPGETVDIKNGKVFVNDEILDENTYLDGVSTFNLDNGKTFPYTLGDDEYFAMGDNRPNSYDCRSEEIGAISRKRIKGKVIFRIFPVKKMGNFKKIKYS